MGHTVRALTYTYLIIIKHPRRPYRPQARSLALSIAKTSALTLATTQVSASSVTLVGNPLISKLNLKSSLFLNAWTCRRARVA